jgi:Rod binding domain-containing protein
MAVLTALPALPAARPDGPQSAPRDAKAWATAQAFESFFLGQVLNAMSAGLKTDGPFGGGPSEGAWRGMMNEKVGEAVARSGGVGIADHVYQQMLKMQEETRQ